MDSIRTTKLFMCETDTLEEVCIELGGQGFQKNQILVRILVRILVVFNRKYPKQLVHRSAFLVCPRFQILVRILVQILVIFLGAHVGENANILPDRLLSSVG